MLNPSINLFESTGTGDRQEVEKYLMYRLEQIRKEVICGAEYNFRYLFFTQ